MNKFKLKWKIFAFLLGFCSLLLVMLWLFQTVFLHDTYKYIRKKEIEKAIAYVSQNINEIDFMTLTKELSNEKDILVVPTNEFIPPNKIGQSGRGRTSMIEAITETKVFVLENGRTISLTFYAIISPVNATVTTLRYQLYIITCVIIILSVLFAFIIAKRISKPIEDINKSAKNLANGSFDTHFDGHGFLEIGELSNTLNTAAYELSKVENLRRELMANISHDLRTPLALVYSYAEMMHDFPGEITTEHTQIIMDETRRLSSLVNDVLDISKLETGVMQLNATKYNLTESLKKTCVHIEELVKKNGYVIKFEYTNDVYVCADETKIIQVFYNLLINAINYSDSNKSILIKQVVSDDFVKIEVCDFGEGISEEDLPLIWDRYYKVDKTHKRAITGTGLGLSIVKKIVLLHNGKYGVTSEVGKGSTFWFALRYDCINKND